MLRIREAIVVEGRYDKNTLSQVVDTVILETAGFGVFKDEEKLALLRRLAAKRGLIVLTDSDGAGFVIRNFLKGAISKEQVKHAYIPDVYGKERRKRTGGKEGKLGVEGMRPQVLEEALRRAGATFLDGDAPARETGGLTKAGLFALGLTGTPDSGARRARLLKALDLPEHLNTNGLLTAVNALYTPEELAEVLETLDAPDTEDACPDVVVRNGISFKIVDPAQYAAELRERGAPVYRAEKNGSILVRRAIEGEPLPVYSQDGILEAQETGRAGKFVAAKADSDGKAVVDGCGHTNQWQIDEPTLRRKYAVQPGHIADGSLLKPSGGAQYFIQADRDVAFMLPWGEDGALVPQVIERGGYINVTDPGNIYGISARDFADTYRLT